MDQDALSLMERRLSRLRAEHEYRLLFLANGALDEFDPTRKVTFTTSLKSYAQAALEELSEHSARTRAEVTSLVNRLLLPLSVETKARVFALFARCFDESLYLEQFDIQEGGMHRKGERYGFGVGEWGIRTDIERSLHHVSTSNHIRRALADMTDDLELITLQSSRDLSAGYQIPEGVQVPFASLMTDSVDVLKSDGTKIAACKASVQRDRIFMDAANLLIEPSDLIVRRMSNGAEETYRVIDPGFHEAFHGIKANYQMEVRKLGIPEAKAAVQNITYNISGHNARINQNSVDNSTNIVQVDARAIQYIEALRAELARAELPEKARIAAAEVVDEVEQAFRAGKPKKSVVSALLASLPHVADVASIVASIVGLL